MKKISVFCIALLCLSAACKKSSSGSKYHVTATIDGSAQTFNVSPVAIEIQNSGIVLISIEGFSGSNASNTQSMAIAWNSNVPNVKFGVGTYFDTAVNYSTIGTYTPSVSQTYVTGSSVTGLATGTGINHLKLVITAVDSTSIKGTFSGDFYFQGDLSGTKKSITNGDFDVPWKK